MTETSLFKRLSIGVISLWLVFFAVVPAGLVVIVSFLSRDPAQLVAPVPTFENYTRFFDPVFYQVFLDSLVLALSTALACLAVGYPFAYILARSRRRAKSLMLMLVIIPFWTSSLIRTYALIILLKANGVVNSLLIALGLIDEPLMMLYTDGAVLIGLVYSLLPFMILPLYAQMEKLDVSLLEAASDLYAGKVARFFHVTLPLTTPGIVAGFMLTFLPSFCMFYIPDLLGGAKTMLVGNLIKNQFLTSRDWPFGAAASIILTVLMVVLLAVYRQSSRRLEREPAA